MKENLDIWKKIFKGIEDGKRTFCGPHTVQIDLTDKCNNVCIGCWVHSPLLDKKEVFPQGEKELPFKLVKKLINQLYQSGTKEIILSGSGEPFMYPKIFEVIELIKSKGIYLNIITNGTFLNEKVFRFLTEAGVDLITVSIWAGTAKAYIATHPSQSAKDFEYLKDNLKRLALYKQHQSLLVPHVKIYNVICSNNYYDIEAMVDFAKEVDADSIEFQIIDIIEGKTDKLALSTPNMKELICQFDSLRRKKEIVFFDTPKDAPLTRFLEKEFSDLGKIWKNYKEGFELSRYCASLKCKKDIIFDNERLVVSESTSRTDSHPYTFWYKFKSEKCKTCEESPSCLENGSISIKLMNILGVGPFIRRCSSPELERGIYEQQISSSPCYIGWYYARILTTGDVIPCCKAAKHPLGNVFKESFPKVWHSSAYRRFRFKAKSLPKNNPYFSKINCTKSCDNWGMNLEIIERLKEFKEGESFAVEESIDKIVIIAKNFILGNFNPGGHNFGKNLIIDGGEKRGFARYKFEVDREGEFELWSRYASGEFRPVDIYIDDNLIKRDGLDCVTGGWTLEFSNWREEFDIRLSKGKHTLEIRSSQSIPHIEKFVFFKGGESPTLIKRREKRSYLKVFAQHTSRYGLKEALLKIAHNLTPQNLKERYLEILGIYDGEYGYKGPFHVQIDLTNNCNNTCVACWCNSPLLKEKRLSEEEKRQYLPLRLVKELLDEISQMGATEVYYSGGGEPFMHPQITEVLEYTKKKGLTCHVNTNFTLLDKNKIDCLIDLGVDFLTLSVWAGTPEVYCRVHPGRTKEDFYKVRENLIYLNKKKKEKFNKPLIKVYEVMFNMNYFEIEEMIKFAESTRSESIEFTLADTIPGATDILKLNQRQTEELTEIAGKIKMRLSRANRCPSGLLLFQFDQFLRRISITEDVKEAKYDRNIIDSMPCYIGWLFVRVIPNGEVHSCLKAHRIPTGSLYLNSFSEIWNSEKQVHFRKKILVYKKDDPFFKLIGNDPGTKEAGCYKSCDDIGRNTWMHNRMKMLSMPERLILKGVARTLKASRELRRKKDDYTKYHQSPVIAGILHGRKAFIGPEQVVIDPTNKCNLRCVSCWLYSPFLKDNQPGDEWLRKELPKDTLIKLIDDLASLGTKRIRFTGGGEPFMYKDLLEIIEYAQKRQLLVAVTTNFGLVPRKDIKRLIDLGLDELCISIWASNSKTYNIVHPGTPSVYFEKLKENLLYLKEIKKDLPRVTFANVIMNANFGDFEEMYEFGLRYGTDALYFTIVDVFPGQTDRFLMNGKERKDVLEKALKIKERAKRDRIRLEFFDGFLRRISKTDEDFAKGEYDKFDIDKIPCYVGWVYSRILADGSVVPCCRGVKKIMGNIKRTPFKDIWFSSKYNEFRARAKYQKKDTPYFRDIGCIKECDNLMHNENVHRKIYDKKGGGD